MDFNLLAEARYSVRTFDARPVEADKLELIVKAGRIAPTGCNNQSQRILVLDSEAAMEKLKKCTRYTFGAPMAIIVCYDGARGWVRPYDEDNAGAVDAAIAATHMMMQAADLGLGTTWVGDFEPAKVEAEFNLPDGVVPVAILPLGHPADHAKPSHLHGKKLDAGEVVFYNEFPG